MPFGVGAISLMEGVSSGCWQSGGGGSGNCSVCDILVVIYNVGRFIFLSMAGVALIMFLFGAIGLILNMGNPELVARNKKLILNTLLAVIIIITAFTLVNAVIYVFSGKDPGDKLDQTFWKSEVWYIGPTCE